MKIKLINPRTKWGWDVKSDSDLLLALEGMDQFACVYYECIQDAINQCKGMTFDNVNDLTKYILTNYI